MRVSLQVIFVALTSIALFSCKKMIEEKQKDLFISAMITGEWYVEIYMEGTTVITDQFTDYTFKFAEDGTVTGTRGPEKTYGTWTGDIANYSINSNFPTAGNPIRKLNASWKITDTENNFVHAESVIESEKMILQLKRK